MFTINEGDFAQYVRFGNNVPLKVKKINKCSINFITENGYVYTIKKQYIGFKCINDTFDYEKGEIIPYYGINCNKHHIKVLIIV